MGPLSPNELKEIVNRSEIAQKYTTALEPQSAYEILGGKILVAASRARRKEWWAGRAEPSPPEPPRQAAPSWTLRSGIPRKLRRRLAAFPDARPAAPATA